MEGVAAVDAVGRPEPQNGGAAPVLHVEHHRRVARVGLEDPLDLRHQRLGQPGGGDLEADGRPLPDHQLRPGMYATVKIGIERREDALLVPVDALLTEKAGASVFTVADGKAKKIKVQTGFNDGANVEMVKGLDPNQPVILLGKRALSDGQAVQAAEAK